MKLAKKHADKIGKLINDILVSKIMIQDALDKSDRKSYLFWNLEIATAHVELADVYGIVSCPANLESYREMLLVERGAA